MLKQSKASIITIFMVVLLGFYFALPNFVNSKFLPNTKFSKGLDLQGGSYLLLEVDFDTYFKEKIQSTSDNLIFTLKEAKIPFSALKTENKTISFKLRRLEDENKLYETIKKKRLGFSVEKDSDAFLLKYTDREKEEIKKSVVSQSIEIVRKRIDPTGTKEINIMPQSNGRIVLEVPGVDNPDEIKKLLNTTAKMTFHLMDESTPFLNSPNVRNNERFSQILPGFFATDRNYYLVKKRVELDGSMLKDARSVINETEPAVSFSFDRVGARKFGSITTNNTGRPFAIVLDGKVISAPVIREPILGGSGVISGQFTLEETKTISLLLRAGALPAPINILEESTIGPSLGAQSIEKSKIAFLIAILLTFSFMIIKYKKLGLIASASLLVNIVLIIGMLSIFNATLTLPGIAGIILTIGMAVDANILIFERIKEEESNPNLKKFTLKNIENAFALAKRAILDSNITTILAGFVIYQFGFGVIKGFAVTLCFGIVTSVFSALMVTRLMLYYYYKKKLVHA